MEMPDFSKTTWRGIPRSQIIWNPTVNEELCTGCGACFKNCPRSTYDAAPDTGKPIVARPLNCVVGCTGCANQCSAGAISFPDKKYLINLVLEKGDHIES